MLLVCHSKAIECEIGSRICYVIFRLGLCSLVYSSLGILMRRYCSAGPGRAGAFGV